MSWEYLPNLDKRYLVIANFLAGKTKNKVGDSWLEKRVIKIYDIY